jgi:hypothetical protein
MIVDSETPNIKGGMLIDWDLCKVIDPPGEGSSARQYTRTVSQAYETCLSLLTYLARELGSSWQLISFSTPTLPTLSYMTSNLLSGSYSGSLSHKCQICGAPKIARAFSTRR